MFAAIIFSGFAGLYLVIRRKDMITIAIGVVLLIGAVALLIDHMELLRD
jgi:multisubunit Na+/H+ antiporter MnhC subunit